MNKKYFNLLIIISIFLFLFEIFEHSNLVTTTIYKSTSLWFYNLVPTIFPIYIVIDLLINYNAIDYLSNFFGKFMTRFFKMKKETAFVFLLSLISGFPSSSKYIKSLLEKNIINELEANKLLAFTHFSNPLFIIESIGSSFLKNPKIGFIILGSHYLTNFLIGFFNRNSYINLGSKSTLDNKKKTSFINCLKNSIYNTLNILFLLYGIITFFMIITTLIKTNLNLSPFVNALISGILEITEGIYFTINLNISLKLKATLITFFLSFGGFCIHMQVFSILDNKKINYLNYFLMRLFHAFISSSLVFLILSFMI